MRQDMMPTMKNFSFELSVDLCVMEIEGEANALAEKSSVFSDPTIAAMAFERAREKFQLANEVRFFGKRHPYFQQWLSEQE